MKNIIKYKGSIEDKNSEYYKHTHNDENHLICCDCGKEYRDFNDLSVEDDLWSIISPSYDKESGILCPTCILKRLRSIGCYDFELKCKIK